MPCFNPLRGWKSRQLNKNGNRYVVFDKKHGFEDLEVNLPCGQCIGCRLERSRAWAIRCMHESSCHLDNSFITLTYAPEHLPPNGSLVKRDFQLFMKSLRFHNHGKDTIRYYHCGEYGEKFQRPHYHAILFGLDFPDKQLFQVRDGIRLYTSDHLHNIWKKGFCTVGDVTFESAAYVARYVTKKITGPQAESISNHTGLKHYESLIPDTGEIVTREPEYATMSRRPGIGREWYEKFKKEVFPSDEVIMRGKKLKPPRYYTSLFQIDDPAAHLALKRRRLKAAQQHSENNTMLRLHVRETVQKAKANLLIRPYEKGN